MALVAFLLGLALGIGFCLCQQFWLGKQLRHVLGGVDTDTPDISLPMMSRLRRAIANANQQRELLERELETWQQLVQVAPFGFVQVDEENQLVWCNQQAQQLLQIQKWHPGEARLLLKFVRSYELDQLIENTRQEQKPGVREWVFYPACEDGAAMGQKRSLTLRGYSWPLPDDQVGVFLENRQPLVALAQSRDRWVSDLSHELKTPLTSIRLVAEALQGRLEPPWNQRVERLLGETNRLIQLVQDWLELSHMEVDSVHNLSRQSLELHSLINAVWQTLELLARQKQLSLAYSGPASVSLEADESRLYRVFLNIFDNSIRYSPFQGTIQAIVTLFVTQDPPLGGNQQIQPYVQIDIIDSGPGFPESDLPHVFERLYRGDPARARQVVDSSAGDNLRSPVNSGTGLGLAIVQQIVQAHGGSVKATNHPQTGGAWLQIQLPSTAMPQRLQ